MKYIPKDFVDRRSSIVVTIFLKDPELTQIIGQPKNCFKKQIHRVAFKNFSKKRFFPKASA